MYKQYIKSFFLFFMILTCTTLFAIDEKGEVSGVEDLISKGAEYTSKAYGSFYGDLQTNIDVDTAYPVVLNHNRVWPHNITRPFPGDATMFKIGKEGRYSIAWTLTINNPNGDIVVANLYDVTTQSIIPIGVPSQGMEGNSLDFAQPVSSLSGQTIVRLKEGTILQLTIDHETEGLELLNPQLTIFRLPN